MARRDEQQRGVFGRWWANQSDRHYQIITNISILSAALLVWGIIFLFVLSGASDPSKENLVALTWIGMVVGGIGTFYVAPEFFYYSGQKQLLDDILLLDSRAEVLRRRKEGEDAAIMLGSRYMRLMRGLGSTARNPRSTVGTVTEIHDYLRLLFAHIGKPHCWKCDRPIQKQSVQQIVDTVKEFNNGTKFYLLAPVVSGRKGEHRGCT